MSDDDEVDVLLARGGRRVPEAVRRLAEASVSPEHPQAGALPSTVGSDGRSLEDAVLVAYLAEFQRSPGVLPGPASLAS